MKKLLLYIALAQAVNADTVIFKDETSMNGVVTYKDGRFQVAGKWQGKQTDVKVGPLFVKAVRFNSLTDNASPPREFPLPRGSQTVPCEVVLAGDSEPKTGSLELIDEARVTVAGTGIDRKRVSLIRFVEK